MSLLVSASESSRGSDIDLSDAALPIGPIAEAAFREAVTEMALLTPDHRFLRANPALCRLLGRSEAELIGMAAEDLAHPDDRPSFLAALDDARAGVLRGFRIWGRAIGSDGVAIPMLVAFTLLRGETGEELGFFAQVLDVETSPSAPLPPGLEHQPVVDFACDREGRLVNVSPVVTLFGWNPEELQNVPAFDLVHPADRARAAAALHTVVLQPGVPVALPRLRFRDREGAWWPVDGVAINLLEHQPGVIRVSARIGVGDDEGRSAVRILDPEPDERAYFARELHDGLGQILTSLSLFARSIEGELTGGQRRRLAALRVLADEALATTRSLAWSLRPSAAPPEGLAPSLRSLATTIESRTGLSIEIAEVIQTRFPVRIEAAVYKIVEEALTNVMRHASAQSVTIAVSQSGDILTVVIADDGEGFEPEHRALTPGSGMGLLCMEERVRLLDGTVRIESAPGRGTVVRAALPVPALGSVAAAGEGMTGRPSESRP
ncbi:MAG TPA: PAS domain S-box protein [Acidimicrobiia bacterium]|nr:PAS domain S-box protein [Acidimicrobiia bacterium]